MVADQRAVAGLSHTLACAALPWVVLADDRWVPVVAVVILALHRMAIRSSRQEPFRSALVALSALCAIGFDFGWTTALGWLAGAGCVGCAVLGFAIRRPCGRPDAIDFGMVAGWATAVSLRPELVGPPQWSWLSPLLLLVASRRAFLLWLRPGTRGSRVLGPPQREVRGTFTISGAIAGRDGLPLTRALEIEVLAGTTLAIVGDDEIMVDLAEVATGGRTPIEGQVCVDGVPLDQQASIVACVGPGEPFIAGSVEDNLAVLRGEPLNAGTSAAVREVCALDEVERELGGGLLAADGAPLGSFYRLLIQAARVLASHYRVVVVVDPMPWVNPVRAEIWRQAVVRASVGRTALWITSDRQLARRADRALELRYGTLRPFVD